jgi:hypothetical protein
MFSLIFCFVKRIHFIGLNNNRANYNKNWGINYLLKIDLIGMTCIEGPLTKRKAYMGFPFKI